VRAAILHADSDMLAVLGGWVQVQAGLWEHWASFTCRLDPEADPSPVSLKAGPKDGSAASSSKPAGVSGTRYKLQPLVGQAQEQGCEGSEGAEEPPVLPPEGKVRCKVPICIHQGCQRIHWTCCICCPCAAC
jgi:hypothetical protein